MEFDPNTFIKKPAPKAITASASAMTGSVTDHIIQNRDWQREGWDFYHAMGEFNYGVSWLSSACSRIRLVAAKKQEGGDEPEKIDPDKATGVDKQIVDLVEFFGGGIGGRSAMLKSLAVQLSVPGEGYVIGQELTGDDGVPLGQPTWSVKSSDEIRRTTRGPDSAGTVTRRSNMLGLANKSGSPAANIGRIPPQSAQAPSRYEIRMDENRWDPLPGNSIVFRVWNPDEQFSWRAVSATLPALPILRELDMLNRRIISELTSRLAMNGVLGIPEEATFPVRAEFADAADPFIAELIDQASRAIQTPGSARAALPLILRMPAAFLDKITHIQVAQVLDPGLMEARDKAIGRLATTLNMPKEVLLGMDQKGVNHWTAWQIDETGIKLHISPLVEIMCHAFTVSFLLPAMQASGIDPETMADYVVWYDITELTTHPDLSSNATTAHDRAVISDAALRRETGFSEDDAPDDNERKEQLLMALALLGNVQAVGALYPDLADKLAPPPPPAPMGGAVDEHGNPLPANHPANQPGAGGQPGAVQPGAPNNGRQSIGAPARPGTPGPAKPVAGGAPRAINGPRQPQQAGA
jgi:hypothetical protein